MIAEGRIKFVSTGTYSSRLIPDVLQGGSILPERFTSISTIQQQSIVAEEFSTISSPELRPLSDEPRSAPTSPVT